MILGTKTKILAAILAFTLSYIAFSQPIASVFSEVKSNDASEFISRMRFEMRDAWNYPYNLTAKLLTTNTGTDNGETWREWIYCCVRTSEGGIGNFGDTELYVSIWDARNVTGRQHVEYDISRSGWGNDTVWIDDVQVLHWDGLQPGHPNPALGYFEGIFP
jgi:hypothetical protein